MRLKTLFTVMLASVVSTHAFAINAKFADKSWDGKTVPGGQQCQKFGGKNPSTPKLIISDIPSGTNAIVLEYSDRDYKKMDNGGHGKISFSLNSSTNKVVVPSVPGHSFDLPASFKLINAHLSPGWDKAGAYMPPCSGGKGHTYYVTIKAVKDNKVTATTVLEMGKY